METPTTETPAAVSAPVELSLDEIVAAELKAADATGTPVVPPVKAEGTEEKPAEPATEEKPAETTEAAPAEAPAEEEKPDDISARRVRTMLAELETRKTALDERERTLGRTLIDELRRAPKATLAKFGTDLDQLIDSSIAEGKGETPAAEAAPNPLEERLTRLESLEQQKAIDNRKAEIKRDLTAAASKFPIASERADDVLDYMIEHHEKHGQPISWDKAAAAVEKGLTGIGIAVAKKLGWSAPAAKTPAVPTKDRPGTTSIGGSQREAAPPTSEAEPEDPEKLLQYLVAQAGLK